MVQRTKKLCTVDGCGSVIHARGLCSAHYQRWLRKADPSEIQKRYLDPNESLHARTEWQGNCLVWTATIARGGYGHMSVNGKLVYAHKFAWEREHGPVPNGKMLDHTCHNAACVNLEHLRIASRQENNYHKSGPSILSTTGFRNVFRSGNKWIVVVYKDHKKHYFGTFSEIEKAAAVAEQARQDLFGEFAGRG